MAIDYQRYTQADADKAKAAAAAAQAQLSGMKDRSRPGEYKWGVQTDAGYQDTGYQKAYSDSRIAQQAAAGSPQKVAETQVMDATFGRGNAVDTDPRVTAAMDALDPTKAQNNMYGQLTDATAAQAGAQGDMLREQMAQAGIQMNDPAAQARLRNVEASRMQANNAGLGQAQQAGMGAAAQQAQIRLQQMGLANQSYGQGASMLAQKQFGQQFQSAGYNPVVPRQAAPQAQPGQPYQAWQPPQQAGQPAQAAQPAATSAYKPMSVADRNAAQAAWAAGQTKQPAGTGSITPQSPTGKQNLLNWQYRNAV